MNDSTVSILFAGVGGQGVVLSSEILSLAAMTSGLDVKKTEVHGVAQRGGTVLSHVRFGKKVYSPLSPVGRVDYLIALEKLEGLRYSFYLKPGGVVFINNEEIIPTRYIGEKIPYPERIEDILKDNGYESYVIYARDIAEKAGSRRAFNVAILGALSRFLDIKEDVWKTAITRSLPAGLHKLNLTAFELGVSALGQST